MNHLTLTKLAVFLATISQAGWNRFSSIYLLSAGFTPSQIGQVKSTSQVAKVLAQPIWGILSDVYNPLSAITISTFLGAITLVGVRSAVDVKSFSKLTTWRMIRSAVTAAGPALDALVLRLVEGTSEGYGKQRLWGSIAWGLSSLCAGSIIDMFGEGAIFVYTYVASGILLLFFVALGRIMSKNSSNLQSSSPKKDITHHQQHQQKHSSTLRICQAVREISRGTNSLPICIILLHNFGYGITMVLFDSILMLQLERDFGLSRSIQGVFTLMSIASSLPIYHYSYYLKEKIGYIGMIQSSIGVAMVRLCLTKLAVSEVVSDGSRATWLLLLQLLHGKMWYVCVCCCNVNTV
jgi:MFS family permease